MYHSEQKRKAIINLVILLIFLIGSVLYYRTHTMDAIDLQAGETSLSITGPDQFTMNLSYEEILDMELVDMPEELGMAVGGGESRYCIYGEWSNEVWGNYTAALLKKPDCCICITMPEILVVINFESSDATKSFYEAFLKLLGNRAATSRA